MHLARAVGRNHDDRRPVRTNRPELGNAQLIVRKQLEQKRFKRLISTVDLVDEQHGRRITVVAQCVQQRPFNEELAAVQSRFYFRRPAGRLGKTDCHHLPRVIPLVGRAREIQALETL